MGLLSAPLLDRFGFHWQLRYYELKDMVAIVLRPAKLIDVTRTLRAIRVSPCHSVGLGPGAGLWPLVPLLGSSTRRRALL